MKINENREQKKYIKFAELIKIRNGFNAVSNR